MAANAVQGDNTYTRNKRWCLHCSTEVKDEGAHTGIVSSRGDVVGSNGAESGIAGTITDDPPAGGGRLIQTLREIHR